MRFGLAGPLRIQASRRSSSAHAITCACASVSRPSERASRSPRSDPRGTRPTDPPQSTAQRRRESRGQATFPPNGLHAPARRRRRPPGSTAPTAAADWPTSSSMSALALSRVVMNAGSTSASELQGSGRLGGTPRDRVLGSLLLDRHEHTLGGATDGRAALDHACRGESSRGRPLHETWPQPHRSGRLTKRAS